MDPSPLPAAVRNAACIASARRWRSEAEHLREMARAPHLTARQSATLLREADAADRQADWWLAAHPQ